MENNHCDGKSWGFVASDVPDPAYCISRCRQRLLETLIPEDETFEKACEALLGRAHGDKADSFWDLYCCDSQLCGVDNRDRLGKDPNVNWFINTCQNIGFQGITDPGPPKSGHQCPGGSVQDYDPRCHGLKPDPSSITIASSLERVTISVMGFLETSRTQQATLTPTRTTLPSHTVPWRTPTKPTAQPSTTESPSTASSDSAEHGHMNDHGNGLTKEEKVTIGVSVTVGAAAIIAILIFLLRTRWRCQWPRRLSRNGGRSVTSSSPASPAPLVSSAPHLRPGIDHPPLTPPPRLQDRQILPAPIGVGVKCLRLGSNRTPFPESPIFSPTRAKLIPRWERRPYACQRGFSPLSSPTDWSKGDESLKSYDSGRSAGTSPSTGSGGQVLPTDILSPGPMRPPRPHDSPLEIPGLVSPGPPPNRSLPLAPLSGGASPSRIPHTRPLQPYDVALPVGTAITSPSDRSQMRQDTRDLCELTEEYARGSRTDSWGSWGTLGGGGPGVASLAARNERDAYHRIGDDDLERFGGRY